MSNSGLYGSTGNVTVSANNLTTLYNSVPGATVTTQNVPDRNFTTLYASHQADINPTRAYGNSNVQAFLNVGSDQGGNVVQNINMTGTLTVGNQSNLGSVSNVHITGGTLNYVLATDGNGGLSWVEPSADIGEPVPYIHFDVSTTANNQQFSNVELSNYANANVFNLFKNGINIEPSFYVKTDANTVQVNIPLASGDTIDILASGSGGGLPAGNIGEIQYNGGSNLFSANSSFTFNQANSLMTVGNISTSTIVVTDTANLGSNSNVIITGGSAAQVLATDGAGNLYWTTGGGGGGNGSFIANGNSNVRIATSDGNITMSVDGTSNVVVITTDGTELGSNANVFITGGNSGEVLSTDGVGNLSWIAVSGGSSLSGITNANVVALGNTLYANAASGTVLLGDNSEGTASGVAVGYNAKTNGGGITIGPYAGSLTGAYNITMGTGGGSGTSGDFNINLGVDTNSTLTGNNNVLFGRSAAPSSSSVNGEITLGGSYTTNTRIPYGNFNVTSNSFFSNVSSNATLSVTGTTNIQQATEKVTTSGTGSTGTITYDLTSQAVVMKTANATANFVLNFTNIGTVITSYAKSITVTFINKNGGTAYYLTSIEIDGVSQTVYWSGGVAPIAGTVSGYDIYSFNIIETSAGVFTVFGIVGGYQ